jgi:hypothetical protein
MKTIRCPLCHSNNLHATFWIIHEKVALGYDPGSLCVVLGPDNIQSNLNERVEYIYVCQDCKATLYKHHLKITDDDVEEA